MSRPEPPPLEQSDDGCCDAAPIAEALASLSHVRLMPPLQTSAAHGWSGRAPGKGCGSSRRWSGPSHLHCAVSTPEDMAMHLGAITEEVSLDPESTALMVTSDSCPNALVPEVCLKAITEAILFLRPNAEALQQLDPVEIDCVNPAMALRFNI